MSAYVKIKQDESVLELTLSRTDKKNALNQEMYMAIVQALKGAKEDSTVRCVLLAGEGDCFTSGNDLADFAEGGEALKAVLAFLEVFGGFKKPIVVAVQGEAIGVGSTLLLHADLVYASPDTQFSLPFVKLGLCPEFASSYCLPRLAGHVKAFEWLVLGEPFGAMDAASVGLINKVSDSPLQLARKRAQDLSKLPPNAVVEAKRLIKAQSKVHKADAMGQELNYFAGALGGVEFKEAVAAFFEKRPPNYT